MTDQTPETNNSDQPDLPPAFTSKQVENFLTLDQIMTSARRVRRVARICLAADLEADWVATLEELGTLVTADGELVNEDASMDEAAVVAELRAKAADLRARMAGQTFSVMFEAMNDDDWDVFEKTHRNNAGKVKDLREWQVAIISACAVNPTMTPDQVKELRTKLGPTQITEMSNQAYAACATGGVDVPKFPSYWHSPRPEESSLS